MPTPAAPEPPAPTGGQGAAVNPQDAPGLPGDATQGTPPREHTAHGGLAADQRRLSEAWRREYQARRRRALDELPPLDRAAA